MGTRAMISVDGKPFVTTHWDGYPTQLGKDLLTRAKNVSSILRVAKRHSIDFANLQHPQVQKFRDERFREISKRTGGKYTPEQIKRLDAKGKELRFGVHGSKDSPITSIKGYGDWAEYQYDFDSKTRTWKVAKLSGEWNSKAKRNYTTIEKAIARQEAEYQAYQARQKSEAEQSAKLQQVV